MNIEQALKYVKSRLAEADSTPMWPEEAGNLFWAMEDEIRYLVRYVETMRAVPTTHDSKAEGESWDQFFEDIRKVTNGC